MSHVSQNCPRQPEGSPLAMGSSQGLTTSSQKEEKPWCVPLTGFYGLHLTPWFCFFFNIPTCHRQPCKILNTLTIGSHEPCQPALPWTFIKHLTTASQPGTLGAYLYCTGGQDWLLSHQLEDSIYISMRGLSQNTCYSEILITYERFSTEQSWHTCGERKCCEWRSQWVIW